MSQDLLINDLLLGELKKYTDRNVLDSVALCGVSIISHACS